MLPLHNNKHNKSFLTEISRCAHKRITTLHNARRHNYFITQGNYIGYMFRLLFSHLQDCLSFESQDAMHTLGSHLVYIHGNR